MFRFIRITNQNTITLFEIENDHREGSNYNRYHLLNKSMNSNGYNDLRIKSKLSNICSLNNPLDKSNYNIFTNLFWSYEYPMSEDFVLFRIKGRKFKEDDNHIVSLTNRDIKNILSICSRYDFKWEIKNEI